MVFFDIMNINNGLKEQVLETINQNKSYFMDESFFLYKVNLSKEGELGNMPHLLVPLTDAINTSFFSPVWKNYLKTPEGVLMPKWVAEDLRINGGSFYPNQELNYYLAGECHIDELTEKLRELEQQLS